MTAEEILELLVFNSMLREGGDYNNFASTSLENVFSIEDVLPFEFYVCRRQFNEMVLLTTRGIFADIYRQHEVWGVGYCFYVQIRDSVRMLAIVRGGYKMPTTVFVDWKLLEEVVKHTSKTP